MTTVLSVLMKRLKKLTGRNICRNMFPLSTNTKGETNRDEILK